MSLWDSPLNLLREEMVQMTDEGALLPAGLWAEVDALATAKRPWDEDKIWPLYEEVARLPVDLRLLAAEPSELGEIRALRPEGPRRLKMDLSEAELLDRFHGAWTGRSAGCALGKPVEGMGMRSKNGAMVGRADIKAYLQLRQDWPLKNYFSNRDAGDHELQGDWERCMHSYREIIAYMEPDDDIHYSLVGLGVLEEVGPDFKWSDVANYWSNRLPLTAICTAERQAILNFFDKRSGWHDGVATPAYTRTHHNPYREWIGAQIRSDGWAWCCAGKPELAAEFAFRDACWTHTRNGIYGEMFMAAIQAAAFVIRDPDALVQVGLSEIPVNCRLARVIRKTLELVRSESGWEACVAKVESLCREVTPFHYRNGEKTAGMNPVATINNAAFCVLALFYGKMDTLQSTAIAVMCGCDTDCNGATVGSIVGARAGRKGFDPVLADPLHDTIKPSMIGFEVSSMADLAKRTLAVWKKGDAYRLA
ncbi:MAG: ADP-ribosylglycohydrolase family protein [candidate division FCPU426 bacterium]